MAEWREVIASDALANGEHCCVEIDGTQIAVFKIDNQFYAIEDICTHDGTEIADGQLDGLEIICPRHGARFCLKTGAVKSPPAYEGISCFPVRCEQGKVFVKDNRWD